MTWKYGMLLAAVIGAVALAVSFGSCAGFFPLASVPKKSLKFYW